MPLSTIVHSGGAEITKRGVIMSDESATLLLGHARVEITPPLGVPMTGYAYRKDQGCTSIDEPLFADACYLQQNDTRILLFTTDLCIIDKVWGEGIRQSISDKLGIPFSQVLIFASHTHFAPAVNRPVTDVHKAWRDRITEEMIATAVKAAENPQPVTISTNTADISRIAFNRRPVRVDGTCCTSYRLPPPEDNLTFRAIDPKQTVIRFDSADGRPALLLVSTPMHAVVGSGDDFAISPDYPGALRTAVESVYGVPMMFAAGTAGNVVPYKRGPGMRKIIGNYLAGAAIQATEMAEPCGGKLGIVREVVDLPTAQLLDEESMEAKVQESQQQLQKCEATGDDWAISRAAYALQRAEILCRAAKRRGPSSNMPFEMSAIGFGQLGIVCLPGEIFAETGLYIQARSPFPHTLVLSLANHSTGYLVTRSALWEGGYECTSSSFSEESENYACQKAIEMLLQTWEKTRSCK